MENPLTVVPAKTALPPSGCYLLFQTHSEGVLLLQWSATPVPEACAFFSPTKPVPKFKFTSNGGKSELIRSFRGPNRGRFFEGVCQFFRMAKELEASCAVLLTNSIQVLVRMPNGEVNAMIPGELVKSLSAVEAVACLPETSQAIVAGVSLMQPIFIKSAQNEGGGAIAL
jgi:hypothetical protein